MRFLVVVLMHAAIFIWAAAAFDVRIKRNPKKYALFIYGGFAVLLFSAILGGLYLP